MLWLYTKNVTDDTLKVDVKLLVDLWLFADRRTIPLLINEMIDALHVFIADSWTLPTLRLHAIHEPNLEDSPLRRMLTYTMSHTVDQDM